MDKYELVMAKDVFDDDNKGLIYGINWLGDDEEGEVVDCEWFKTEEERYRCILENQVGQVWNTKELQVDFTVHSFLAPCCFVTRKKDQVKGTLEFSARPRFYYRFIKEGL